MMHMITNDTNGLVLINKSDLTYKNYNLKTLSNIHDIMFMSKHTFLGMHGRDLELHYDINVEGVTDDTLNACKLLVINLHIGLPITKIACFTFLRLENPYDDTIACTKKAFFIGCEKGFLRTSIDEYFAIQSHKIRKEKISLETKKRNNNSFSNTSGILHLDKGDE